MSLAEISTCRIGLIAGGTDYPVIVAKEAKRKGYKVLSVALEGHTKREIENYVEAIKWVKLGQLISLIEFFKANNVEYAIMAGNVKKENIFQDLNLDPLSMKILKEAKDKRDSVLLELFADELRRNGIELLDARTFLEDYIPRRGALTKIAPDKEGWEDIIFGWEIAKKIAGMDIGLAVTVKDKVILSVEAIEGTDEAIRRGARYGGEGIVVVKVARPNQDLRFDLPVVGVRTIRLMKEVKARALAIEAEKSIFFEMEEGIREAEEAGIAIVAI